MKDSRAGWFCIEVAAQLLAPRDREVVLGDLAERDRNLWRGLVDVLGLAARRQLALWQSWRPWAASLGLALPASLFLMGWSVAISGQARPSGLSLLSLLLVISWAWMAGFVAGAVSRGTLWATVLACGGPCLYCLSKWPEPGLSGLRLLIFVLPGLWGLWRGLREPKLGPGWAFFLAAVAMLAPLMSGPGWMHGLWLLWPGWYLTTPALRKQE